jgi:hypothetical protein
MVYPYSKCKGYKQRVSNSTIKKHLMQYGKHPWRTPNSSKDPNVGPSRKQQKREESGHAP